MAPPNCFHLKADRVDFIQMPDDGGPVGTVQFQGDREEEPLLANAVLGASRLDSLVHYALVRGVLVDKDQSCPSERTM